MMYVMRVPPSKSSQWTPPAPEERITTGQLMEQRETEKDDRQEVDSSQRQDEHTQDGGGESSTA